MQILSVSEMQKVESTANDAGHSYMQMMDLAGGAVAQALQQRERVAGRRILVLVGPGNNGGDGLVAARRLHQEGAIVTAYLMRARAAEEDPVFQGAVNAGVGMRVADEDPDRTLLKQHVLQADVIIDALLGTGASPPLRGAIADILENVHAALSARSRSFLTPIHYVAPEAPPHPTIVAVDGPSGLDFDTGDIDDLALQAHLSVTFAYPKWGHVTHPGAIKVGDLIVADIGIPETVRIPEGPHLATATLAAHWLPARAPDAHKGTFGKAMIVAGSANYTGAAILASRAAVRAGAGLVTLALPSELHAAVVTAIPEVTYLLLPHTLGIVNGSAVEVLLEYLKGYTALLIGPGLGNTTESRMFMDLLLDNRGQRRATGFLRTEVLPSQAAALPPMVIDADGLNLLAQMPDWTDRLPADCILTPHPGEMARLTGTSAREIQADRLGIATRWAETWRQVVVLKGAFTIIAAPGKDPVLLPFANAGLSSAGTGDVLAGTITALRAQGQGAFEAAVAGGYIHGLAAEIVTRTRGTAGTAAGDVVEALGEAWRRLASMP
jgi:ADP-dependent NAD(P)H-hydrate dehydratase / NAD(P)H-hydrate epimerase